MLVQARRLFWQSLSDPRLHDCCYQSQGAGRDSFMTAWEPSVPNWESYP